ncbi:MAG: hypothetical protein CMI00_16345 [Oceanospirillaceae bacterium]|nr:hypothetical protein [Oceanospirillaceae bacterium]|tara:strand:- start:45977 stop:48781 length:2805 start_codon:yes stop_codon:yes gene_type:complete
MKRIVANFLLVAAAASATPAVYALGLGELTLNSALNQPLNAEIDLLDTGGYSEDQIRAALATYEEFARAGVDRPQFLTGIKFKLDGDRLLLTTREAVNEPFLNFLIELNWPSGRVLREYTLLLDPPTFSESTVQPLVSSPALVEATKPAPKPARREIPEYKNPAAERWSEPAAPGQYKVRTGDTLWSIASAQAIDTGVTPQQMMVAIQQTNPNAFMHGNINQLKAHVVLDIPSASEVGTINSQVAANEVRRQNQEWSAGAAQLDATDKASENAQIGRSSSNGEVRLLAANSTTTNARSGGLAESGAGSETALEGDLAIALENLDKSRRENAELTERLSLLEEQLEKMERLVSLQSDELANLQGTSAEVLEAQVEDDMAADAAEQVAEEDSSVATAPVTDTAVSGEDATDEAGETSETVATETKAAAEPAPAPTPVVTAPVQSAPDLKATMMRYKEFVVVAIGLVIALILALVAVRRRRMEDEDDEFIADDYDESDFADGQTFQFEEMPAEEFDAEQSETSAEEESDDFLFAGEEDSGESESDLSDVAGDESETNDDEDEDATDVITQADHYIVYGKFDQAVKMLKEGSDEEPQRADIRLKLLELLATLDESEEFAIAEAGLNSLGDEEANAQAAELRKQLSVQPAPVYVEDTAEAAVEEGAEDDDSAHELLGEIAFEEALDLGDTTAEENTELDFMFDEAPAPEPEAPVFEQFPAAEYPVAETSETEESLTIETPEEELQIEEPAPEETLSESGEVASETPIDFVLDDDSHDITLDEEQTETVDAADDPFSIDFPDEEEIIAADVSDDSASASAPGLSLVTNEPESAPVVDESAEPVFEEDLPTFDLMVEGEADETLTDNSELEGGIDLDELEAADDEFDFLTGTDECATKLDLARAYVDMEDYEGAKELLQEVVQEGSDQQKQDARELMDKIA